MWESFKEALKRNVANLFTLGNLVLGMLALFYTLKGFYELAISLVFLAMVLDGLDGKLAVKLNMGSELGKQLDSLCDLVSFGVAPAAIFYVLSLSEYGLAGLAMAIFFTCAGAYRLARFNITFSSAPEFTGLPITIAGGALAALAMHSNLYHTWVAPFATVFLALLMISRIPYPAPLKGQRDFNLLFFFLFYSAVTGFIFSIVFWREMVFYGLGLYIAFGVLNSFYRAIRRRESSPVTLIPGGEDLDC